MKWLLIAAIWCLLALMLVAFFHAMVSIRDMEEIDFSETIDKEDENA